MPDTYLSFFLPVKLNHSQLEFVYYKQIKNFGKENLFCIAPDYFFLDSSLQPLNRHLHDKAYQQLREFKIPDKNTLNDLKKITIPSDLFDDLKKTCISQELLDKYLQEEAYDALIKWLDQQIRHILSISNIKAILSWRDCKSLEVIAKKYNIPIIYNEYGPYRKPEYVDTLYFDLTGVKNTHEVYARYEKACMEQDFPWETVIQMTKKFFPNLCNKPQGRKFGLLLGVEQDSAHTNGYTNIDLINYALENKNKDEVIIRPHPWANLVSYNLQEDTSSNLAYCINELKEAITIYSNAGIELLTHGIPVTFIGNTPLKFLSEKYENLDERVKQFGFFILCYMIPEEFLFDDEYYSWRLVSPSETDIARKSIDSWNNKILLKSKFKIFNLIKEYSYYN